MKSLSKALVLMALTAAAAPVASAEPIERRAPADARGEVQIINVAGEVRVIGWDRAEVQVNANLGAGVERLDFERDGQRTQIRVVLPGGRSGAGASDLIVRAPRESSVSVNTVSAEQTLEGVRGAQRLQAVSGSIKTEVWDRDLEVKTVSGDVEVSGHGGGAARVTSVSGDVLLADIGRELDINTVTGDMDVRMQTIERARIKTTNGDLELAGKLAAGARIDAEAVNGDLKFFLGDPIDAEFNIETFNGDINNCFGPEPRRRRESAPGNELRFTEGEGSARVRIKTLNGDVEVCRR